VNEVQLIRAQLGRERQHAAEVVRACADALSGSGPRGSERLAAVEAFRQAGVEYIAWILSRFEERDQVFHDLLRKRFAAEDPNRRAVEAALGLPGSSREALTKLETALRSADSANDAWMDFLRFFSGAWSTRRDEIDRLFERQAKVTDWRTVSDIDADSIVDERGRYARVKATLPPGIEIPTAAT
jgi:hypothetical protein